MPTFENFKKFPANFEGLICKILLDSDRILQEDSWRCKIV